jgi:hypothetical protein
LRALALTNVTIFFEFVLARRGRGAWRDIFQRLAKSLASERKVVASHAFARRTRANESDAIEKNTRNEKLSRAHA